MSKEVYSEVDPKIRINLRSILEEKNISIRELSRRTETRLETVRLIANGKVKRIPLETLGKICRELNVNIGDILEYERD